MLAAVVSLEPITRLLQDDSVRGRAVFVIDHAGHIVAHPDTKNFVPGADASGGDASRIVEQVENLPKDLRTTATIRYTQVHKNRSIEMIGTYSTFPDANWAVIAERSLKQARADAGVNELNRQALAFVTFVTLAALLLGYFFAVGISGPIRGLAASTRAISRGEFHQRSAVRGASEISELAENFNKMAGDIEEYIEKLKESAEVNRELFLGSIRMLAAAIDEKDPYTRGHSGRVAKYSTLIARELGLSDPEVETLRISALLHDVGKIGVEDRVLKKPGALTPEEFALDETAHRERREHHAPGFAAQRNAAGYRTAPRTHGRARLSLWLEWPANPDDGAHYRRRRHARRDDHEPPVSIGNGFGLRAR